MRVGVSAFVIIAVIPAVAQDPVSLGWVRQIGGSAFDTAQAVAIDGAGDIIVAGTFMGTADLGQGAVTSAGASDIFIAKYTASNGVVWAKHFGGPGHDEATGVAVDGAGNIFVVGRYEGNVSVGGAALPSSGNVDVFVAKYDSNGTHQWSGSIRGDWYQDAVGVGVDPQGNVIVGGSFKSSTLHVNGVDVARIGELDAYLAKFSATGAAVWAKAFGGTADVEAGGLAVDGAGGIVLTGRFKGTANFGGGNVASQGYTDIVVAKYKPDGAVEWIKTPGSTGIDAAYGVAIDSANNIFVTGYFENTINFGDQTLTSAGATDTFLVEYSASGVALMSRRFGNSGYDRGVSVAVDEQGNIALTGLFMGTLNLGGPNLQSNGFTDVFVLKLKPNGDYNGSTAFGGPSVDAPFGIAARAGVGIVVVGAFGDTVNFGSGPLTANGLSDAFVVKLAP